MPIDIKEVTDADIGLGVIYNPRHGAREDGVITSYNDNFIFVNYGARCMGRGIATSPNDLTWLSKGKT